MAKPIPSIYTTGKWEIDQPFQVDPQSIYVCKAIKSFDELAFNGVDVFAAYYEPLGITVDKYEEDRINLVSIITLMSDTNSTVYVPSSYIRNFPDTTSIPYAYTILSVPLGALPDSLPLDDIKVQIADLVTQRLGITTQVGEHVSSRVTQWLSPTEHASVESNRKAVMLNNATDRATILALQEQVTKLEEANAIYEQIIKDNGLLG